MAGYAELHCHSNFSFLDGASSAEDLAERAVELGLTALAVTDHQGLYGAVRFAIAADEAGIRPILGLEIELLDAAVPDPHGIVVPAPRKPRAQRALDARAALDARSALDASTAVAGGVPVAPRAERLRLPGHREPVREDLRGIADAERGPHLVLLARDEIGYRSLCRLVSAAQLAGTKGVPRFGQVLLAAHTEGLVALSGCRHGEIARRLLAGDREGAAAVAARYAGLFGSMPGRSMPGPPSMAASPPRHALNGSGCRGIVNRSGRTCAGSPTPSAGRTWSCWHAMGAATEACADW